jgi:hypothetical protein
MRWDSRQRQCPIRFSQALVHLVRILFHEIVLRTITYGLANSIVTAIVQSFFAHRIYKLSNKKIILLLVLFCALLQIGKFPRLSTLQFSDACSNQWTAIAIAVTCFIFIASHSIQVSVFDSGATLMRLASSLSFRRNCSRPNCTSTTGLSKY